MSNSYVVDRAKSARSVCGRAFCPRSKKGGLKIPKGVVRFQAIEQSMMTGAVGFSKFYCLRPDCVSDVQAQNALQAHGRFENIPGMAELPEDMRNAAVRCLECITSGDELDEDALKLLDTHEPKPEPGPKKKRKTPPPASAEHEEEGAVAEPEAKPNGRKGKQKADGEGGHGETKGKGKEKAGKAVAGKEQPPDKKAGGKRLKKTAETED